MNLTQRFKLMVKGNLNNLFDQLEDPERSLNQLILDMEEQLEAAKRAAAAAMANEDRLRAKIAFHDKDTEEWQAAARRAVAKDLEDDARLALRRAQEAGQQAQRLKQQLAEQTHDTTDVREAVARLNERLGHARSRLQITQARMRQSEARKAAGQVMRGVERANLHAEFDRLEERVERVAAEDRAYIQLDDCLSGQDLRRRFDAAAMDDAVEDQLQSLRLELSAEL